MRAAAEPKRQAQTGQEDTHGGVVQRLLARRCRVVAGLAVAGCILAGPTATAAGTLAGNLQSQIQLTAGCIIAGSSGAVSGVSFGMLDFGTRPSTFTGIATATPTGGDGGAGPTQIVCSPDVLGISIAVGPGSYAGSGATIGAGSRAMRNGALAAYIPYEIYRDSGHTTAYPTSGQVTGITVPANGAAFALPLYGQINKTDPVALPAGMYTDTVQVTLTY
jgi:spore coat protein U-like protein